MKIPSPYQHYPPGWSIYDKWAGKCLPQKFGFVKLEGDINRFGARYRLASSFEGLKLDGYTQVTSQGYDELLRVFFAWSAFEQYSKICGLRDDKQAQFLTDYGGAACVVQIRRLDEKNRYLTFVTDRIYKKTQKEALKAYLDGHDCSLFIIASAIRHIFVHGPLTPNANQVEPRIASSICKKVSSFLLLAVGSDFKSRFEK